MKDNTATAKFVFLLFYFVCFLQLSGLRGTANYVSVGLFIVIIFLLVFDNEMRFSYDEFLVFLFLFFYTVTSIPKIDMNYYMKYIAYYVLVFSPVLLHSYYRNKHKVFGAKISKSPLLVILAIWFFMVYVSIGFYLYNPDAARALASHEDSYEGVFIGGYQLSYGSSMLCVALWGSLIQKHFTTKLNILVILLCASLLVLIYLTESTLTTFATLAGIVTAVIANMSGSNNKRVFLILTVIVVLLLVYIVSTLIKDNLFAVLSWLDERSSIRFFRRISEILNSVYMDDQSRHYEERQSLIVQSLDLFVRSPLIGHGYKYGNIFEAGKIYGIGNHSELSDSLARYGLIGSAPLLVLYYKNAKLLFQKNVGLVVTFVMLVSFNPFISFASNLSFFLLIPVFYYVIGGHNSKR